jgi:DNA-binding FadR family transcriptional regulator
MSLTEEFVEKIEEMIFTGKLKPGERMPTVRALMQSMQMSQTVVNNGISILAQRGLLKIAPRKGTYVADYLNEGGLEALSSLVNYSRKYLPVEFMQSMYEFRLSNERAFFHLAAKHMTASDFEALHQLLQDLLDSPEPAIRAELSYRITQFVSRKSKNDVYAMITNGFKPLYDAVYEKFFSVADISECAGYLTEIQSCLEGTASGGLDKAIENYHAYEYATLNQHHFFSQSEST